MQSTHYNYNSTFSQKEFPIILILDNVKGPANIGGLFRLADAFHIEKIISCGPKINMNSSRLIKSARSTVQKVHFEQQENTLKVCSTLFAEGYSLLALEITNSSIPINTFNFGKL